MRYDDVMAKVAMTSLAQSLKTGLWFLACRALYGVTGDWIAWLRLRPEFRHIPVQQLQDCYVLSRWSAKKKNEGIFFWFGMLSLGSFAYLFVMVFFLVFLSNEFMFIVWLILLCIMAIFSICLCLLRYDDTYCTLRNFVSAYRSDGLHLVPACFQCRYDLTGVVTESCPECGKTRLVHELIRDLKH